MACAKRIAAALVETLLLAAIRWGSIGPLVLMSAAIMGSPGPATVSLVAVGSVYALRRSLPYLLGIIAGTVIVLLAVAAGITAAILAIPALHSVITWIAVAYILWLAYQIVTSPLSASPAGSNAHSFAGGMLLGVANPKGWIAIATVFASNRLADGAAADAGTKIAVLTAMIIVILTTWLVAGASIAPLLRDRRRARVINAAFAVALVGATALALLH